MKNQIGLDTNMTNELVSKLNTLLSDYMVFYQNTRGFHWNIKGEKFFELHLKFEELYDNLILKIDEIAERILTLGGTPIHTFNGYIEHSSIPVIENCSDGVKCVEYILDSFKTVIVVQREILTLSGDAEDEGTNALMSDYIREQEKLVWMYSSFLK